MNGLYGVLQVVLWACAGVAIIMSGGIILVVAILAFIGKLFWTLLTQKQDTQLK